MENILTAWFPAIGIFLAFALICFLLHWLALKIIHFIVARLPGEEELDLTEAFLLPGRIMIIAGGLMVSLMVSPLSHLVDNFIFAHTFKSILVICVYWIAYNLCTSSNVIFRLLMNKHQWHIDNIIASSISTALHALIICFGFASLASVWGFDLSGFIAGLSIGGLAFSLAAKDSLSNIFAGLVIIIDRPFTVGDWIVCNNIEGTVEAISFRSTCVRTFPQALVYIPNSLISSTAIINYSKRGKQRLAVTLGVTYDTTCEQLEALVEKIKTYLQNTPSIQKDNISVTFDNMNSSSLDIRIVCYCTTSDYNAYLQIKEQLNLTLMHLLAEVGASAAFPSTSVYIEKAPQATE